MVRYLRQVLAQIVQQLAFQRRVADGALLFLGQLVEQLPAHIGKVGDEVERVLDFVGNAGRQLAQAGHLLALNQLVLGYAQLLQRVAQLLGLARERGRALGHHCFQSRVLGLDALLFEGGGFALQPFLLGLLLMAASNKDEKNQPQYAEALGRAEPVAVEVQRIGRHAVE